MCGIAGIYGYGDAAPPVDRNELIRIRDAMRARGPDGAGEWISQDRRVALAHRRLAIIDVTASGAQPMSTLDRRFTITFNGEIYNYRALRRGLEAKGYVFQSQSDTEVLLHLYANRGPDMVHMLRGMYAFGIWDASESMLFLARDPFGIKPLYYADDGRTLRFASQVKAVLHGASVDLAADAAGAAGFLLWGFVPEPFTLYRGIHALPAGCWMRVGARGARPPERFFDLAAEYREAEERAKTFDSKVALARLPEVLADSVAHHLVADVPVGVFLSAGVDSSAIAVLAARVAGSDLRCVTLGFEEYRGGRNDETILASETARALGARHAIDWIAKEDFYDEIPELMAAMDQPSIDGINTYFVARAAARQGLKVALSGLGGDEMFLGYPSFRDVPRITRAFAFAKGCPRWVGRSIRVLSFPIVRRLTSPKYAGLVEYGQSHEGAYMLRRGLFMPWELPSVLGGASAREGWERLQTIPMLRTTRAGVHTDASIVSCLELAWYMRGQLLRDADWAGMAHSLEIRVPFVDIDVMRAAATLAAAGAIRSKRDVAALPALGLPSAVTERPKSGFLVPVRQWLNDYSPARRSDRHLRGWARKVLRHSAGSRSVLNLLTDAFGGSGGIALYGRDFLSATCRDPASERVVAIPRLVPNGLEPLPSKLRFDVTGINGKFHYIAAVARTVLSGERFDVVVCGHINLLPVAVTAAIAKRAHLVLLIYGVEAWSPQSNRIARRLLGRVDAVFAISRMTLDRFLAWGAVPRHKCSILPNAIHLERYGPGRKSESLIERYAIKGRVIIMTLGRLGATERYKGFDEVLEVMSRLITRIPNLAYLIAGDGSDRERLEDKVAALGLQGRVVFTGYVPEIEKADHYRLADAYVMPSHGEGFGFVFLEALACGIPAVGSTTDGGREALREGMLGRLVDPANAAELEAAIFDCVQEPKRVPEGIDYFSFANFEKRCNRLMARTSMLSG